MARFLDSARRRTRLTSVAIPTNWIDYPSSSFARRERYVPDRAERYGGPAFEISLANPENHHRSAPEDEGQSSSTPSADVYANPNPPCPAISITFPAIPGKSGTQPDSPKTTTTPFKNDTFYKINGRSKRKPRSRARSAGFQFHAICKTFPLTFFFHN